MIASVTEPDLGLKIPDALIHHSPKNKVLEKCFIFTFLIKFCELVNKFIDLSVSSKISKCHYSAQKKYSCYQKTTILKSVFYLIYRKSLEICFLHHTLNSLDQVGKYTTLLTDLSKTYIFDKHY